MSDTEYIVRQAKLYDVPQIAWLEQETSSTPWSAASLTNDITKNDKAYVAVVSLPAGEGEVPDVLGYADMWVVAGEAQLNNIAIAEKYRGQHLGEMLLSHMINKARSLGCELMTLEVRSGNTPALSLYDKMGFTRVAVRRGYYRNNHEDAILMNRVIGEVDVDYETNRTNQNNDELIIETEVI